MKNKIYNIILIVLITTLVVVAILIAIKYGKNKIKDNELACIVQDIINTTRNKKGYHKNESYS